RRSLPGPVCRAGGDTSGRAMSEPMTEPAPAAGAESSTAADRPLRLVYIMSRFPKATETFVLYEILALEALGHQVEVFPLVREHEAVVQPGAEDVVARAHEVRPLSLEMVRAQLHWLRRRPRSYLAAWAAALRGNVRSPRFLARAVVVVPLAAAFAR